MKIKKKMSSEVKSDILSENYFAIKEKIISTDKIIKNYNVKCQENEIQKHKLDSLTLMVENLRKECAKYENDLSKALQEIEPLKSSWRALKNENISQVERIERLQVKLNASEKLVEQYDALLKNMKEDNTEPSKKKLISLEKEMEKKDKIMENIKEKIHLEKESKKKLCERYKKTLMYLVKFGGELKKQGMLKKTDKNIMDTYYFLYSKDIFNLEDLDIDTLNSTSDKIDISVAEDTCADNSGDDIQNDTTALLNDSSEVDEYCEDDNKCAVVKKVTSDLEMNMTEDLCSDDKKVKKSEKLSSENIEIKNRTKENCESTKNPLLSCIELNQPNKRKILSDDKKKKPLWLTKFRNAPKNSNGIKEHSFSNKKFSDGKSETNENNKQNKYSNITFSLLNKNKETNNWDQTNQLYNKNSKQQMNQNKNNYQDHENVKIPDIIIEEVDEMISDSNKIINNTNKTVSDVEKIKDITEKTMNNTTKTKNVTDKTKNTNEVINDTSKIIIDTDETMNDIDKIKDSDETMNNSKIKDADETMNNGKTKDADETITDINETINNEGGTMNEAGETMNDIYKTMNDADKIMNAVGEIVNDVGKTINNVGKILNDAGETMNDAGETMNDAGKTMNDVGKTKNDTDEAMNDADKAMNDADKAMNDADETMNDADEAMNDAGKTINDVDETINNTDESVHISNETVNNNNNNCHNLLHIQGNNFQNFTIIENETVMLEKNNESKEYTTTTESQNEPDYSYKEMEEEITRILSHMRYQEKCFQILSPIPATPDNFDKVESRCRRNKQKIENFKNKNYYGDDISQSKMTECTKNKNNLGKKVTFTDDFHNSGENLNSFQQQKGTNLQQNEKLKNKCSCQTGSLQNKPNYPFKANVSHCPADGNFKINISLLDDSDTNIDHKMTTIDIGVNSLTKEFSISYSKIPCVNHSHDKLESSEMHSSFNNNCKHPVELENSEMHSSFNNNCKHPVKLQNSEMHSSFNNNYKHPVEDKERTASKVQSIQNFQLNQDIINVSTNQNFEENNIDVIPNDNLKKKSNKFKTLRKNIKNDIALKYKTLRKNIKNDVPLKFETNKSNSASNLTSKIDYGNSEIGIEQLALHKDYDEINVIGKKRISHILNNNNNNNNKVSKSETKTLKKIKPVPLSSDANKSNNFLNLKSKIECENYKAETEQVLHKNSVEVHKMVDKKELNNIQVKKIRKNKFETVNEFESLDETKHLDFNNEELNKNFNERKDISVQHESEIEKDIKTNLETTIEKNKFVLDSINNQYEGVSSIAIPVSSQTPKKIIDDTLQNDKTTVHTEIDNKNGKKCTENKNDKNLVSIQNKRILRSDSQLNIIKEKRQKLNDDDDSFSDSNLKNINDNSYWNLGSNWLTTNDKVDYSLTEIYSLNPKNDNYKKRIEVIQARLSNPRYIPTKEIFIQSLLLYLSKCKKNVFIDFLEGKSSPPLLTNFENNLIAFIMHIENKRRRHLKPIVQNLQTALLAHLFTKEHHILYGAATLCRLYIGLCRQKGELEKGRVFCFDLFKKFRESSVYLVSTVAGVWPSVLLGTTNGPLEKTYAYILFKAENNLNTTLYNQCKVILEVVCNIKPPNYENILSLGKEILQTIEDQAENKSNDHVLVQAQMALELLTIYSNKLSNQFFEILLSMFKKYQNSTDDVSITIMTFFMKLFGTICEGNYFEENNVEIIKTILCDILNSQISTFAIQETAFVSLVLLQPKLKHTCHSIITNWLSCKQNELSNEMQTFIEKFKLKLFLKN